MEKERKKVITKTTARKRDYQPGTQPDTKTEREITGP